MHIVVAGGWFNRRDLLAASPRGAAAEGWMIFDAFTLHIVIIISEEVVLAVVIAGDDIIIVILGRRRRALLLFIFLLAAAVLIFFFVSLLAITTAVLLTTPFFPLASRQRPFLDGSKLREPRRMTRVYLIDVVTARNRRRQPPADGMSVVVMTELR